MSAFTCAFVRAGSAALVAVLAFTASANSDSDQITIASLNTPFPEFVSSGNAVSVRISGKNSNALLRSTVTLNGVEVTTAFTADPATRSISGMIVGLRPGSNLIEVFPGRSTRHAEAQLTVAAAIAPQSTCPGLASLVIPPALRDEPTDVILIDSATPTAATASLPAHCIVRGRINPRVGVNNTPFAIGFELRLPDAWSGRFFFQGGGGNDGVINPATGNTRFSAPLSLTRGFAVVSTDGGHTGTSAASYGFDPQARIDHAYNAYDKTAVTAKAVVRLYYARQPDYSYFIGCSGGGRQGMMFTQRFPDYFDGVVAAAPAMRVATGASTSSAWETITYNSIAPVDASGNRILSQAFSNSDLALVSNTILAACDARDGVADGLVFNFEACRFDPAVLQCSGAKNDTCLAAVQVAALKRGFGGPVNSGGRELYTSWIFDAGISGADWRNWKLGTSTTATPNSRFVTLIEDAMKNEFFTPPDPAFSIFNYNFDTDPARQAAYGLIYDTWRDAKLKAFRKNGGKVIFVNGLSDPIFSAQETIEYFERLVDANGGAKEAAEFASLFLVPGMNHCGSGPAVDRFDVLTPLIDWVENDNAPEHIVASGTTFPGVTRPLCPHPKFARYSGQGSTQDASNFACAKR